jgi:FkbM family methyltransferase
MRVNSIARLRQGVRNNRARRPFTIAAEVSQKYLRAFYNEAFFEFTLNGERRVIDIFASVAGTTTVTHLDVGAHTGEWTADVLTAMPHSRVVCFEIVPDLASALRERLGEDGRVTIVDRGLSSTDGQVFVTFNRTAPSTSAIVPRASSEWFVSAELEQVRAEIESGDNAVHRLGVTEVGILKIDVEGHEIEVLEGFRQTLQSSAAPRLIQFEYGETYLPVRHTLKEAYDLLGDCGYSIGRVYPRGVGFKPYELKDDHFRMGNYIAAKATDPLHAMLVGRESR